MSLFAQLGTRIFGGLSIVLLIAMGLQTARLSACHRHGEKVEAQLADANATIRQFQATGERIEADRAEAVKAAKAERATIQTKIERIVIPAPVAGCDTPPEVMEAFK
jgi:multidrug resistance efflux pump